MTNFKNGDTLRNKETPDQEILFVGMAPNTGAGVFVGKMFVGKSVIDSYPYREYLIDDWELKPKKEKRWIAVWPDNHIYHAHNVNKDTVKSYVEREYAEEYADKAQYLQIEVEV